MPVPYDHNQLFGVFTQKKGKKKKKLGYEHTGRNCGIVVPSYIYNAKPVVEFVSLAGIYIHHIIN